MILVVQCSRCSHSRRFSTDLAGRRFRCPKCRKGIIKVPDEPSSSRLQAVEASQQLYECRQCGTHVPLSEGDAKRRRCPDCKSEREFTASSLEEDGAVARKAMQAARGQRGPTPTAPRRAPVFILGMVLGLAVGIAGALTLSSPPTPPRQPDAIGQADPPVAPPATDPKPPVPPREAPSEPGEAVEYLETPTGKYRYARLEDLTMEGKAFVITEVVDGDTMHLGEMPGDAKIRLLGVDTPETKHATKGLQFYGKQASAYTKKRLEEQRVVLHIDPDQPYGVFGRPLAYIELEDGTDFNASLIKGGYARVTTEYPFSRMTEYLKYEAEAKAQKLGMWDDAARAEWDKKKEAEAEADRKAEADALAAEMAERKRLMDEARAEGGIYVRGQGSDVVHKAWCPRRPKKDPLHFPDLESALADGGRKHRCFEDEP